MLPQGQNRCLKLRSMSWPPSLTKSFDVTAAQSFDKTGKPINFLDLDLDDPDISMDFDLDNR